MNFQGSMDRETRFSAGCSPKGMSPGTCWKAPPSAPDLRNDTRLAWTAADGWASSTSRVQQATPQEPMSGMLQSPTPPFMPQVLVPALLLLAWTTDGGAMSICRYDTC